jgi:hypothetical protein
VSPESIGEKRARASEAAASAFRSKVAALGAVTLPEAAAARGIERATLEAWVRRGRSTSFSRGPRRAWVVRLDDLDTELQKWACSWGGCTEYALLSAQPEGERLCKQHAAAVRRDGKLTATEFAQRHGLDAPSLMRRLEAREIPAERVERGGRPVAWLLVEQEALRVLDQRFRCPWLAGCDRYGVGPTHHCSDHAGAATAVANARGKIRKACVGCGAVRDDFPSQQRRGPLCGRCHLKSEEFDRKRREAVRAVWAPSRGD